MDRLLHAIALRQSGSAQKTASAADHRHAEIIVALDAIASWIGRTEKRLEASPFLHQAGSTAVAKALAAIGSQIELLDRKIATLPEISAGTIAAITDMSLEIEQLQASLAERARQTELTALEDRFTHHKEASHEVACKLQALEQRLTAMEQRLPAGQDQLLLDRFSALAERLDEHVRFDARSATSALHYFEQAAEKIESIGNEIRLMRKERAANAEVVKLLPALLAKLEELQSFKRSARKFDKRLSLISETLPMLATLPEKIECLSDQIGVLRQEKTVLSAEIAALKSNAEQKGQSRNRSHSQFPSVTDQLQAAIDSLQTDTNGEPHQHTAVISTSGEPVAAYDNPSEENGSGNLQIRAGFIAAARRAAQIGDTADVGRDASLQTEPPRPTIGRRFFRSIMAGSSEQRA